MNYKYTNIILEIQEYKEFSFNSENKHYNFRIKGFKEVKRKLKNHDNKTGNIKLKFLLQELEQKIKEVLK